MQRILICISIIAFLFCGVGVSTSQAYEWDPSKRWVWNLPAWMPFPIVPEDNPMSREKVELGRHLFYEKRLSVDGSIACATCHDQARSFTDGRKLGVGIHGALGKRNVLSLANVGYLPVLTWANPNIKRLEQQALIPIFSDSPVEMGMAGREAQLFASLKKDALYEKLFSAAFPNEQSLFSLKTVTYALAAFQRTLISVDSPYDQYRFQGRNEAISDSAKRGEDLFFSHRLECYHCHFDINFTNNLAHSRKPFVETGFHNTGLYNVDGKGAYPSMDRGLFDVTGNAEHIGRFRTPSLRNVEKTAPYMHDGSVASLDEVLEIYNRGGRIVHSGPLRGDGATSPLKDPFVVLPDLSIQEIADLKAFLLTLTDQTFLSDPRFSNPWKEGPNASPLDSSKKILN